MVIIGISILVWLTMYKTWQQRWMYLESRDEPCEKNKEKQLYDFLRKWTENGGNYAGTKGK